MAKLTGQAALDFINRNPNARYTVLNNPRLSLPQTPEPKKPGFIGGLLKSITKPFRQVGEIGLEGLSTLAGMATGDRIGNSTGMGYNPVFLDDQEYETYKDNSQTLGGSLKQGAQTSAGLGSFFVPGSLGAKGALTAGGLAGFGASDADSLEGMFADTALGAGTGIATYGAFKGLGKLGEKMSKKGGVLDDQIAGKTTVGDKLRNFADDRSSNMYRRQIGKAAPNRLGAGQLETQSRKLADQFGYKVQNADDLISFSDDLFNQFGSRIDDYADELTAQGGLIDVGDIKKPLVDKLAKTNTPQLQKPIQKVLDQIDEAVAGKKQITPKELLSLRREWGELGKFNPFTDSTGTSKVWEKLYKSSSDKLDDTFKQAGYTDYREINKILETAIKQKKWGQIAKGTYRAPMTVNDMAQDVAGYMGMSAGPGGSIPGFIAGKAMQSPRFEGVLAGGANKLAGLADNIKIPTLPSNIQLPAIPAGFSNVAYPTLANAVIAQDAPQQDFLETANPQFAGPGLADAYDQAPQDDLMMVRNQRAMELMDMKGPRGGSVYSYDEALDRANMELAVMYGIDPASLDTSAKPKSELTRKIEAAKNSAGYALELMNQNRDANLTGPFVTPYSKVKDRYFGGADEKSRVRQELATTISTVRNALLGSAQSEAEIKGLMDVLPDVTMPEDVIIQRLEGLLRPGGMLDVLAGGSSVQQPMYDPYTGNSLADYY